MCKMPGGLMSLLQNKRIGCCSSVLMGLSENGRHTHQMGRPMINCGGLEVRGTLFFRHTHFFLMIGEGGGWCTHHR